MKFLLILVLSAGFLSAHLTKFGRKHTNVRHLIQQANKTIN